MKEIQWVNCDICGADRVLAPERAYHVAACDRCFRLRTDRWPAGLVEAKANALRAACGSGPMAETLGVDK